MTDPAAFVMYCFGISLVICALSFLVSALPKRVWRRRRPRYVREALEQPIITSQPYFSWSETTTTTEPKETVKR